MPDKLVGHGETGAPLAFSEHELSLTGRREAEMIDLVNGIGFVTDETTLNQLKTGVQAVRALVTHSSCTHQPNSAA